MLIVLTEETYKYIINDELIMLFVKDGCMEFWKEDTEYMMSFKLNANNVDPIYRIILDIYENKSGENNRWIFANKEYLLSNDIALKYYLYEFEGTDIYPLKRYILSDVIKDAGLKSVQQARELAKIPFSGYLYFDQIDISRLSHSQSLDEYKKCIKFEHKDVYITNRYIPNSFEIAKGEVYFRNCILDGDVLVSGASKVKFSQCIITGKITCVNASYVYLSSVNVKELMLYNSRLDFLRFEYSKIYRFVFHSCSVTQIEFYCNKFIEPYLANLDLPDNKIKINMSQFVVKNINEKMVKKINKDAPIKIKNENNFYLSFLCHESINPVLTKDVAFDMVDTILAYGNLDKEHRLYSDMKYKKALYSNRGLKRVFVCLTGAFYVPSRWIMYLILNIIIFTAIYIGIPFIQFMNITTSMIARVDFWTALYYSICQIIGSNPTNFTPVGIAQICTTIQSMLNTVFIANFFAALIKKFMRD